MLMLSKYDDIFQLIWFNLLFSKNIHKMKSLFYKGVLAMTAAFKGTNTNTLKKKKKTIIFSLCKNRQQT